MAYNIDEEKSDLRYEVVGDKLILKVKEGVNKHKGFFNTLAGLKDAYPIPIVGDDAWVGSTYPGVVYDCITRGVWHATTNVPPTGTVNLADYPKKSEMLVIANTNPIAPPTLDGQFHYNKPENRMFVAASGNASPLTQQIESRSLLGTAPATWKIRYNKDSGLVSHFEQMEGNPLMKSSAEQTVDSNELEVVYDGMIPEDREGYTRTLFYGVEPNDTEVTTLEMKYTTLYATYTVAGWFEVASNDKMMGQNYILKKQTSLLLDGVGLLNTTYVDANRQLNGAGGDSYAPNTLFPASGFIEVSDDTKYIRKGAGFVQFYDIDKVFIPPMINVSNNSVITPNIGSSYVRLSGGDLYKYEEDKPLNAYGVLSSNAFLHSETSESHICYI